MGKFEDLMDLVKLSELKKREEKNSNTLLIVLSVIGTVVVVAGIAFAVYKYVTACKGEKRAYELGEGFDDSFDEEDLIELEFDYYDEDASEESEV